MMAPLWLVVLSCTLVLCGRHNRHGKHSKHERPASGTRRQHAPIYVSEGCNSSGGYCSEDGWSLSTASSSYQRGYEDDRAERSERDIELPQPSVLQQSSQRAAKMGTKQEQRKREHSIFLHHIQQQERKRDRREVADERKLLEYGPPLDVKQRRTVRLTRQPAPQPKKHTLAADYDPSYSTDYSSFTQGSQSDPSSTASIAADQSYTIEFSSEHHRRFRRHISRSGAGACQAAAAARTAPSLLTGIGVVQQAEQKTEQG